MVRQKASRRRNSTCRGDGRLHAPVVFDNVASRSMFEKLGFKVVDKVYWAYKPANIIV